MNNTTKRQTYVCKRLRLCRYLIDHGFEPYKIAPNKDEPKHNVYLFERCKALDMVLMKYFNT